jgi:hypothetical protein
MSGSTGETPNWAAGYVPSASEWNSWWGRKVDMSNALFTGAPFLSLSGGFMTGPLYLSDDPVASSQAVNKAYADTKLSGGGGVINGDVTINGWLRAKEVSADDYLLINKYNNYEWYMSVSTNGDHVQVYRPGWFDAWVSAGGSRYWVGSGTNLMTLDGGGNLNVANTVTAATITSNGNIFANQLVAANGVFGKALGMGPWVFYNNGTSFIQEFTPGWYNGWEISGGARSWTNGNIEVMRMTGLGDLTLLRSFTAGYIHCTGQVDAAGAVTALGGQMNMSAGGSVTRNLQMSPNWYWEWAIANGSLSWIGPLPTQKVFVQARTSDLVWVNYLGPMAGIGDYFNSSDERVKTAMVPASHGLADVLKLNPIEFNRIDQDGPREIGFSAQNVRDVIPLAVRPFDGVDGDDPMLCVAMTPVIAALVNGMKELAAEVAALKAVR